MSYQYAQVIVNTKARSDSGSFTYQIPVDLYSKVGIGVLVTVPFGRRIEYGIIYQLSKKLPNPSLGIIKSIDSVVFQSPVLSATQLKLSDYIADYYFCSLGQATFAMVPGFILSSIEKIYLPYNLPSPLRFTAKQKQIYQFVKNQQQEVTDDLLAKHFDFRYASILNNLIKKKVLSVHYRLSAPKSKPKYQEILSINYSAVTDETLQKLPSKPRQWDIFLFLEENPNSSWSDVRKSLKVSRASLNTLIKQNIVAVIKQRYFRTPTEESDRLSISGSPSLFPTQQEIVDNIIANFDHPPKPYFIFGRTGSGKTEIYLRLVEYALSKGKDVIILVPEIALVPQTMQRFYERFGDLISIYHSQMSVGEKYDQWSRMRDGSVKVVIGSRSALFAPLKNIGLIIIDEEHESSYKQDSTPRYHTVTVAEEYARLLSAPLVIGSATPRLETFWRAKKNIYQSFTIKQTIPEMICPYYVRQTEFHVVDLRDEYIAKNYSLLSYRLQVEIAAALQARRQIILFLNRRGHASYVFCRECGYVARCPNCQISLTQHIYAHSPRLICHHCGFFSGNLTQCPDCLSRAIKYYGAGTEKLEEDIRQFFPTARVLRMDRDTTRQKNAHSQIFNQFKNHAADILIGTQMIAKGWDIPNVDLVGIINADAAFHLPDFRSTERNFALLLQLIGRVGRRSQGTGKIILQTFETENPLWNILRQEDYQLFAFSELLERQKNNFPPFFQIVRLVFEHPDYTTCQKESLSLFRQLNEQFSNQSADDLIEIMGPSPCFLEKLHNKFRWHIILKGKKIHQYLKLVPAGWIVDIDPYSIL